MAGVRSATARSDRPRSIERHARDWDDLASEAMYWSIVGQDVVTAAQREAFFASGRAEVAEVLQRAAALGHLQRRHRALDFGCGVGRLTRALAEHFDEVVGVDIARPMVDHARLLAACHPNCRFDLSSTPDLRLYDDASFDLVLSRLVLQHLQDEASILDHVGELVRVVRKGGLVTFQLPSWMPIWQRLQPRRRAYTALRRLGIPRPALFRIGLQPIRMVAVRRETIQRILADHGAIILAVDSARWPTGIQSLTYYVTR